MQVTAEKIDNDIRGLEQQLDQIRGALTVLHNMKSYLEKPEEVVPSTETVESK